MPPRPTWKGYIKVSLVNIPVKVYPATEASATVSFNQLHAVCQTKIQQKKWCPKCEIELTNADIVKGYEFEKGRWVVVDEEDIAKVKTESTKIINLMQFTDVDAIDPMYVDKAYYLAPEGPMAADAYSVMREGMQGKAGIGKLALSRRVALSGRGKEPLGCNSLVRGRAEPSQKALGDAVLGLGMARLRERQPHGNGGFVLLGGEERLRLAKLIRDRWRGPVAAERKTEQLHGSASAS